MTIEIKPHLKQVYELYEKVCEFESVVNLKYTYHTVENTHQYIGEDVDTVIDAFVKQFDFASQELDALRHAMHAGEIDFMRLRFDEDSVSEEEYPLLYIMSRPFFRSVKNSLNQDPMFWQEGRCPVCNAVPSLSILEKEAKRKYFCSFCGTVGHYMRIGCPNCLTEIPQDITVISLDGEEGVRADTCKKCKTYYKTLDSNLAAEHSLDLLDIMSLPLDIRVQGKGYKRLSPNPVGMIRMQ